ncbi:uncharacterized protein LOC117327452 [Pecten maximus]|uniref:uncharacterized protein LOC117327452 n=1 Tax=Pecten maximus TaxID=6579 RepID=UPI0014588F7F|nr:uncharacterized protein LOC117327452 [Pecten maximus]
MTHFTIFVSLLLVFVGEAAGETCRLHILEDAAEGVTMGERLFCFLFFPYTPPEDVAYQLCDTPQSDHWLSLDNMSTIISDINPSWLAVWFYYNLTVVLAAYYNVWMASRYPRQILCKTTSEKVCEHSKRRKFKCRNEDEKRDKLRFLKVQKNKSDILPKFIHLHKINYSSGSLGKLEINGQTTHRHQTAFFRLRRRYSAEKLPRHIIMDLLDAGTLQQNKHALQSGRENSFRDARQETVETLLKRKHDEERNQILQSMSPDVGDGNGGGGGGGDFVDGTNIHNIGRPCASSSFISTFDAEAIEPAEVDSDEEDFVIENNGNLSQGSSSLRRNLEQGNERTDSSPRHHEYEGNSRTHQSFTDWIPNYLPNTPDDTFMTSFDVGTDRSTIYDDHENESTLMTTMMESFVSMSDSLQKTATWYGSDDLEVSPFQWLSAVLVTRRLAKKVWALVFGHPGPRPVYSSPPPRDASPMNESTSTPPFRPTSQQYYPDFQSELPRYEMVD